MDDPITNNTPNTDLAGDNASNDAVNPPSGPVQPPQEANEPAAVQEPASVTPTAAPDGAAPSVSDADGMQTGMSDMAKPVSPPPPPADKPQLATGGVGTDAQSDPVATKPEEKVETDLTPAEPAKEQTEVKVTDVTSVPSGPVVKPQTQPTMGEQTESTEQQAPQSSSTEPAIQTSQDVTTESPVAASVSDVSSPSVPSEQPVNPATDQPSVEPGQTAKPQAAAAEAPAGVLTDDDLKKTHEPIIVLPDRLEVGQTVDVKVRVGMVPHVMDDAHYIQSIELFGNGQSFGKIELNLKDNPNPEATFQVPLSSGLKLKAVIYCNVHGKWESTREV
jgi:superoxide reductase